MLIQPFSELGATNEGRRVQGRTVTERGRPEGLRARLSHVTAGFQKEAHDVATGLTILSSLEVIWDQCGTAERRREFAELLFSRVTVDQQLSDPGLGSQ